MNYTITGNYKGQKCLKNYIYLLVVIHLPFLLIAYKKDAAQRKRLCGPGLPTSPFHSAGARTPKEKPNKRSEGRQSCFFPHRRVSTQRRKMKMRCKFFC